MFLVGCSDGLMPITMADTPEAVEEERRLLYVGVTRARERLVLSCAGARTPGRAGHPAPSRFLDGTAAVLGEAARSQPAAARRAAGAEGRGTRRAPPAAPAAPTSAPRASARSGAAPPARRR